MLYPSIALSRIAAIRPGLVLAVLLLMPGCEKTQFIEEQEERTYALPEGDVLMSVGFTAETVRFSELADHQNADELSEDVAHYVATRAVPLIKKERQQLTILRDGTFRLVIDILDPGTNPAREAFRREDRMQDWELRKLIVDNRFVTGYDGSGKVVIDEPHTGPTYFGRLAAKVAGDSLFAARVNIGNALFRVSAGAQNYLDPLLRPFFLPEDATYETQDRFLMITQKAGSTIKLWTGLPLPAPAFHGAGVRQEDEDPEATYTPGETMDKMNNDIESKLAGRSPADVQTVTAIDSTSAAITAEVIYAGDEQVLSMTALEADDDEQQTVTGEYTESFETDPFYDVDLLNVESVTYSDVEIINNAQN